MLSSGRPEKEQTGGGGVGGNEGWDEGDHKLLKKTFSFLDWCVTKEHASLWNVRLQRAHGIHAAAEMGSAVKGTRACVNKTRVWFPPVAYKATAGYVGGKFSEGH